MHIYIADMKWGEQRGKISWDIRVNWDKLALILGMICGCVPCRTCDHHLWSKKQRNQKIIKHGNIYTSPSSWHHLKHPQVVPRNPGNPHTPRWCRCCRISSSATSWSECCSASSWNCAKSWPGLSASSLESRRISTNLGVEWGFWET
jgi:hypothetical protein